MFRKSSIIGLDIGSSMVKMAQLHVKNDNTLNTCIFESIDNNLGNEIRNNYLNSNFKGKKVAVIMNNEKVIMKRLYLPPMPDKELKKAVYWEASEKLQAPITELVTDFFVLNNNVMSENEGESIEILLLAAKKTDIIQLLTIVEKAKLIPTHVDVTASALSRLFSYIDNNKQVNQHYENSLILDIGNKSSTIVVTSKLKGYELARFLSAGCNNVMKDSLNNDIKNELLLKNISYVIKEINRTLDFYKSCNSPKTFNNIYLSGGGAISSLVCQQVQSSTGLATKLLELDQVLGLEHVTNKNSLPIAYTAIGAALRGWRHG